MDLKLTILGSGVNVNNKEKASPGLLVTADDSKILFDCGTGIVRRLVDLGIDYTTIDYVFISHPHTDHMGDLINVLHAPHVKGLYYGQPRTNPLAICGYGNIAKDLKKLVAIHWPDFDHRTYQVPIKSMVNKEVKFPPFKVIGKAVNHFGIGNPPVGFRLECQDDVFAYPGDSGDCPHLHELIENADLAVLNISTLADEPNPNSLTPTEAAKIAADSCVHNIVLAHNRGIDSDEALMAECSKYFAGGIYVAHDLMEILI